jgi:hypothetical protein
VRDLPQHRGIPQIRSKLRPLHGVMQSAGERLSTSEFVSAAKGIAGWSETFSTRGVWIGTRAIAAGCVSNCEHKKHRGVALIVLNFLSGGGCRWCPLKSCSSGRNGGRVRCGP